jgi:hypothetical protein
MPARKNPAPSRSHKIELTEIILLGLPLLCLGVVLLAVFISSNPASGKPSPNPPATAQAASLATPTPPPTTAYTSVSGQVTTSAGTVSATTKFATSPTAAVPVSTTAGSGSSPGVTPPTRPVQTVKAGEPQGNGIRLTKTEGELKFDLLVSPGHIGDNTYSLLLSENGNQAVTDATLVRLSVTSLEMDMGVATLDLPPAGSDRPGLYSGLDSKLQMLSMFGKYNVAVLVQRPGKSDTTTSFPIMVTGG